MSHESYDYKPGPTFTQKKVVIDIYTATEIVWEVDCRNHWWQLAYDLLRLTMLLGNAALYIMYLFYDWYGQIILLSNLNKCENSY